MTKRILAVLLSALMLLSLATACQDSGPQSSTGSQQPGTPGKVDLSQHREVKLTIQTNSFITSYDDNDLTKKLEEDLNCDITFDLLPAGTEPFPSCS